ncbi:MAG: O-methyltransferase [Cytophagaceae bacterium]|jgi:predicted O-methyltransferase YrrM|nr:O-methyltransferase [Cytophagaceae bacterium]
MEQYILNHIDDQPAVLNELERYTHLNVLRPRMLSGHLQGTVLKMICRMVSPLSILEIGTFTGYSTICMAMGMPLEGHIHTIEKNDELENVINTFFQKAGITHQVTLHIGSALDVIPSIPDSFDLVFIDGDKREYPQYLGMVFSKLKVNGFILADNIFWDGKVAKPDMPDDNYTKGIMDFNDMVKNDSRLEKTIIPLRDGLLLIRKISE